MGRMVLVPLCWILCALAGVVSGNMIPGDLKIANPNSAAGRRYSTEYTAEYFEVYSHPIRTRYSEVYWKMQDDVPLPSDIVERFRNKTMAIVGYEVDQVMRTADGDVPVPITWAYNHHYQAWLLSPYAHMRHMEIAPDAVRHDMVHGATHHWRPAVSKGAPAVDGDIPFSQYFSEANGGEMRRSYHGYPKGFAQLVYSPSSFRLNPMQIDTKNRQHPGPGFVAGPLPRSSLAPAGAKYSGLLECPCTTRISRETHQAYAVQREGTCAEAVRNASECFAAARAVMPSARSYQEQSGEDPASPPGCNMNADAAGNLDVFWNTARSSATCGQDSVTGGQLVAFASSAVNVTVALRPGKGHHDGDVEIMISGPADVWLGVGFGAESMCEHPVADECPGGGPYSIIVQGDVVTERKLQPHGAGDELEQSVVVRSNSVEDGVRTVVVSRLPSGRSPEHFSFNLSATSVPFIAARGHSMAFAQHARHGFGRLLFADVNGKDCVCLDGIRGSINNAGFPYPTPCAPPPTGDLLQQKNPTCFPNTYGGGLRCCVHGEYLLDADQEVPEGDLEYHLKFRYYFEDFEPHPVPSHTNLVRLYWASETFAGEYDIVKCEPGTPPAECVQVITSRWKVRDMLRDCSVKGSGDCTGAGSLDPTQTAGVHLVYAGPHCHAPSCISMELYNADTGRLLCSMEPTFGASDAVYDEDGYVALPPCLWGDPSEGLMLPELLGLDTELLSIKKNNNTIPHYGEMASWQMRGYPVPLTKQHPLPSRLTDRRWPSYV